MPKDGDGSSYTQGELHFDEQPYHEVFLSMQDWAAAREKQNAELPQPEPKPTDTNNFESAAKQPTLPFQRLQRELGGLATETSSTPEITPDRQQRISNLIGRVKSPYDLIQRAEGQETPEMVFYASKTRAVKNIEDNIERAKVRSTSGRAAVRRQYQTTANHLAIASDRSAKLKISLDKLRQGTELSRDDIVVMSESLQEMANGLAANFDNLFEGGDNEARVVGLAILGVSESLLSGAVPPHDYKTLLFASAGYVKKQENLWKRKASIIYNFAESMGFSVDPKEKEKTTV